MNKSGGSSLKIDETLSAGALRVEAFSEGGCSSLPLVAGKREQGVVAPFQERLVNERRQSAFCRWVPACWYKSAPA